MRTIELTPKATEDLESIWLYSFEHYGEVKADNYVSRFSDIFSVLTMHSIGTPRPELGEGISSLPIEQHVIFFLSTQTSITVIRILSHVQDATRHLSWY